MAEHPHDVEDRPAPELTAERARQRRIRRERAAARRAAENPREFKALLIGTTKCAYRSLRDIPGILSFTHRKPWSVDRLLREETGRGWDDWFVFGVCRNPYDRFVSAFAYMRDDCRGPWPSINALIERYGRDIFAVDNVLHPQHVWLDPTPALKPPDMILRLERLGQDFEALRARVGLAEAALPWKNASQRGHWREELDAAAVAFINDMYARDFELFGYEMADPRDCERSG